MYALIPIALIILQNVWEWIRKNALGINDAKIPDNVRPPPLFGFQMPGRVSSSAQRCARLSALSLMLRVRH